MQFLPVDAQFLLLFIIIFSKYNWIILFRFEQQEKTTARKKSSNELASAWIVVVAVVMDFVLFHHRLGHTAAP